MKKIVAIAAAAGAVAAGVSVTPMAQAAPAQVAYEPAPIALGKCERPGLISRGAECGLLEVPLDYANPSGTKIKLAVSRIKAKAPAEQYQGVMLVNPGGPGGSGLGLSVLGEYVPKGAGLTFDWIGFDPRGVGSSQPSLSCDSGVMGYNRPYYVPVTRQLEKTWLDRSKAYAQACATAGGDLLAHLKTTDTAADMDVLRKALGQEQINYYGFSYGTYLGQVYSTLYPERVRRMVLDGNVDPRNVWYKANLNQDLAFDRNIKIYFDWVAKHDAVYHLGTDGRTIERNFYAQQEKLRKSPAGGVIGPDELVDVLLGATYSTYGWADLAAAYSAWVNNGDSAGLKARYDGINSQEPGSDNGFAVYLGVQCTDVQWPTDWNRWRLDNWITHFKAPFTTWGNAWYNAPCVYWGAKAGKPVKVDGSKSPPILLTSETLDAPTPFEGSLEVRSRFPNSALIEIVGGTTHSGTLNGNSCVDDQIADYLATGKLPARKGGRQADTKCDALPQPTPGQTARMLGDDPSRADLRRVITGGRG